MADEVKNIFKDKLLSEPQIQKVLRNKVQGVAVNAINVIHKPLDSVAQFEVTFEGTDGASEWQKVEGVDRTTTIKSVSTMESAWNRTDELRVYVNREIFFTMPTRVKEIHVSLTVNSQHDDWYITPILPEDSVISNLKDIEVVNSLLQTPLGWNKGSSINPTKQITFEAKIPFTNQDVYSVKLENYTIYNLTSYIFARRNLFSSSRIISQEANAYSSGSKDKLYMYPVKAIVTIIAEQEDISHEITYLYGNTENSIEIKNNPLITTRSMYNDPVSGKSIPLHEYLANEIINEWHDGKQVANISKVINEPSDLEKVGNNVKILNTRQSSLVGNGDSQSYSEHSDGTARVFEVDDCEVVYDGSVRQNISVSEKRREQT